MTLNRDSEIQDAVWPGGYPVVYVSHEGALICPDCAKKEQRDDPEQFEYYGLVMQVHWEGDPIICDGCNAGIESAYGAYTYCIRPDGSTLITRLDSGEEVVVSPEEAQAFTSELDAARKNNPDMSHPEDAVCAEWLRELGGGA